MILPCHNEEEAILEVIPKAIECGKTFPGLEIIAVDDGSTDSSKAALEIFKGQIKIVSHPRRRGYGAAIKTGIQEAKGSWMAFCDLDGACEPEDLKILAAAAAPGSGVLAVWGNRLHSQSAMPVIRRIGSRLYQMVFLVCFLDRAPDPCSGFRLFQKQALLSAVMDFPDDLSFSLAFTSHCLREKTPFRSADIRYRKRLGRSKLSPLKDGAVFLRALFKFRL